MGRMETHVRHMKNTVRVTLVTAVVAVALLVVSGSAAAYERERSQFDRWGFYLGLSGMGNFVVNQTHAPVNGFIDQGGGFSIFFGLRLSPMIALEAGYALNFHKPVRDEDGVLVDALLLHAWTLDLKLIFPNRSVVRPYLQAGFGVYELASYADSTNYRNGLGFQLGGGLDFWVNHFFSIGGRALYHAIFFTQRIGERKPFLSTVSVEANIQFHF